MEDGVGGVPEVVEGPQRAEDALIEEAQRDGLPLTPGLPLGLV